MISAVLVAYVRALPAERLSAMHVGEIERQARARQTELRKSAEPRGRHLFAEGARGLGRRVRALVGCRPRKSIATSAQPAGITGSVAANEAHARRGKARS